MGGGLGLVKQCKDTCVEAPIMPIESAWWASLCRDRPGGALGAPNGQEIGTEVGTDEDPFLGGFLPIEC